MNDDVPDTTPPTIAVTSSVGSLKAGETATITFTLSESSADFVSGDVTVSGGTLSNFAGSGTSYTATFTPTANSTTNGVISVASSKFSDAAGNFNADGADANNTVTLTVNTVRPTIAVTSSVATLKAGETATITFTLSQSATDFVVGDVTVSGGTLSGFAGSGTSYTATFTPTANSTTSGVISVADTKFSNAAGNFNADGADANNTVTLTVNTVRPTIAVVSDKASLGVSETATITFTLSETATDFVLADVTATGGTLGSFTAVSGTVYTAVFTPTANSTTDGVISVSNAKFSNAAGNFNADGADANNTVTISVNTVPGALAVTSPVVNEASPYAVFTVLGTAGQTISLALANGTATGGGEDYGAAGTATTLGTTNLEYSLNNGTTWQIYNPAAAPTLTGASMLVRTPVKNDTISDNNETFTLTATPTTGTAATGTCTIKDDGTGDIYKEDGTKDTTAPKDDDRALAVTSPTVNEASPYAVFTVTGTAGQTLSLALTAGTATGTGTDYGAAG
ncbi:MAG: Ig-like domain-containing protein, partial [Opitutaceae bacterium]